MTNKPRANIWTASCRNFPGHPRRLKRNGRFTSWTWNRGCGGRARPSAAWEIDVARALNPLNPSRRIPEPLQTLHSHPIQHGEKKVRRRFGAEFDITAGRESPAAAAG